MNLKKLFFMLTFFVLLGTTAFAQTTVYVDNTSGVGNDFNSGLTLAAPKATITNALSTFPSGTTVSVKGTGFLYNELINLSASGIEKEFIFTSYGSVAPLVRDLTVNLTAVGGGYSNQVTFSGPYQIRDNLLLTAGDVLGATNLTIGSTGNTGVVTITEGTVDSQLGFSGKLNFTYNGANSRTTGGELPAAGNTTNLYNLTLSLTVAKTITLNENKTIIGTFASNANSTLALGSKILTFNGVSATVWTHTQAGNITASTGGITVMLTTDGTGTDDVTFNGTGNLPNMTATGGTIGNEELVISNATNIGSITAQNSANVTVSTAAAVTVDKTKGTGNITNSGNGIVTFSGAGGVTCENISLDGTTTSTTANNSRITFTSGAVTANGNVTNSATVTTSSSSGKSAIGQILFSNAAHVIKGYAKLTGNVTATSTKSDGAGNFLNIKTIEFATIGNLTKVNGGFVNEAVAAITTSHSSSTMTKIGSILFTGRTSAVIGANTSTEKVDVTNTSSVTNGWDAVANQNGIIDFAVASTGVFWGKNVSTSGGSGGVIVFGNGACTFSGNVSNNRTDNDGDINFGDGSYNTDGANVTIGGTLDLLNAGDMTVNLESANNGGAGSTFTVTGKTTISNSGATLSFPTATNDEAWAFTGGLEVSAGTLTLSGAGGTSTGAITSGGLTLTGGTIALGTGARTWTTTAVSHTIGGTTTNPTFTPTDATCATTLTFGTPALAQVQTINVGGASPLWPGLLTVNNGTALEIPVVITGGNLRVLRNVVFQAGVVQLNGTKLILGQNLSAPTNNPNFTNTAGYTTLNNGAVTINPGGGNANISGTGGATYTWGNLEIDAVNNSAIMTGAFTIQGNLYLSSGILNNAGQILTFDNSTTYPTIVRVNGSISNGGAQLVFSSNVNVTYYGSDKTASFELNAGNAAGANKLQDLTIATTDGATAGKGTVLVDGSGGVLNFANLRVNGILNVYANQALLIKDINLEMNGSTITLDGDIANKVAGNKLILRKSTGTTITGSGYLPDISVNDGTTTPNVISGARALVTTLLGADNLRGGAGGNADFDPTTAATGSITFGSTTSTNKLTVTFGSGALNGTHAHNLTTANSGNYFALGGNVVFNGTYTHANGTVDLGNYNLSFRGSGHDQNTAGTVASTGGYVKFIGTNNPTTFNVSGGTAGSATIPYLEINLGTNTFPFTVNATTAGSRLAVSNTLLHTKGTLNPGTGHIRVTGNTFTVSDLDAGQFSNASASYFQLQPTSGTLTWTFNEADGSGTDVTLSRVLVNGDVTPAGDMTGMLTINNDFKHDGGVFTFGQTVQMVGASTFTRNTLSTGTYAGSGYLRWNSNGNFTQGNNFSIPNLRIDANLATIQTSANFTVSNNLYLSNATTLTHTVGGSPRLSVGVASGSIPTILIAGSGNVDVAPTFAQGQVNYTYTGGTSPIVVDATSLYWPTTPTTLAYNLTVNMTNTTDIVRLDQSRTVNGIATLNLTKGVLGLNPGAVLTLADGMTINRNSNSTFNVDQNGAGAGTGTLTATNVNLVYSGSGTSTTGDEFSQPSSINNVTVNNTNATPLDFISTKTINGTLTLTRSASINAANTVTVIGGISIASGRTLTINGALNTPANITISGTGAIAGNGSLGFTGATGQTLTLAAGTTQVGNISINLTGTNPVLNVAGGNLDVLSIRFTNGIVDMGSNTLILPNPTADRTPGPTQFSGLAFDRSAVTGTNVGHVVGLVQRQANTSDGKTATNGRFEFPVGTLTGKYRPTAITFTPSYVVGNPVSIVVSHVNADPAGTVGMPINGGNGVTIGAYTPFYWLVNTTPTSLTSTQNFDMDLTSSNLGVPYTSDQSLRVIRRQDGSSQSNGWVMQGTAANHANYQVVSGTDTTVVARTVSAQGGLVSQGSRFTIGVPARAPLFTAPTLTTFALDEAATTGNTVQFTATPRNTGETITYSKFSGPTWATVSAAGLLTMLPGYTDSGVSTVVVRATSSSGMSTDFTLTVTVNNVNRAPVFTPVTGVLPAGATVAYGTQYSFNYAATDADAQTLTYSIVSVLSGTTASAATGTAVPTMTAQIGGLGNFTWTPAFGDAGKTFTVIVQVTDGTTPVTTTGTIVVSNKYNRGDVTLSGGNADAIDALAILKHVVANPVLPAEALAYADASLDGNVNAYDAYFVLSYVANNNVWPTSKVVAASGQVEFGNLVPSNNNTVTLPVTVMNTKGVNSVSFEGTLNGNGVDVKSVKMSLPSDWIVVSKTENGKIQFAAAGLTPLTESTIANIELTKNNKETVATISGNVILNSSLSSDISAKVKEIPTEFTLSQNYPNPFNPATTIKYSVTNDLHVNLIVYDILGRVVKTLVDSQQEAGYYTIQWDGTSNIGSKVASGIYIYRIQAGSFIKTVKMNLMK